MKQIVEHLQEDLPPKEMISSFFHLAFKMADENALLLQWFQDGEFERITRKVPRQLIEETSQDHTDKGIIFVQALIKRGILKEQDPAVVVGVMQAIMMLRLFKDKLGSEMFPRIMDVIIDCIAEGLTRPE